MVSQGKSWILPPDLWWKTRRSNQTTHSDVKEPGKEIQWMQDSITTLEQKNEEQQCINREKLLCAKALEAREHRHQEQVTTLRNGPSLRMSESSPESFPTNLRISPHGGSPQCFKEPVTYDSSCDTWKIYVAEVAIMSQPGHGRSINTIVGGNTRPWRPNRVAKR